MLMASLAKQYINVYQAVIAFNLQHTLQQAQATAYAYSLS